jgi:predicted small lipoprotein YifL
MRARDNLPSLRFQLRFILPLGAAVVFMLSACGKRGPLYLPDQAGTPQKTIQSVDKNKATETYK